MVFNCLKLKIRYVEAWFVFFFKPMMHTTKHMYVYDIYQLKIFHFDDGYDK